MAPQNSTLQHEHHNTDDDHLRFRNGTDDGMLSQLSHHRSSHCVTTKTKMILVNGKRHMKNNYGNTSSDGNGDDDDGNGHCRRRRRQNFYKIQNQRRDYNINDDGDDGDDDCGGCGDGQCTTKKSICCKAINVRDEEDKTNCDSEDGEDDDYNDEDNEEIPIWICGEPRFVSGITSTTTCNDVIQALIDDELSNVNPLNVAGSRDLNDYVITERWRDVEQILSPDTNILPIWNAWGVARNEVKFRLKINRYNTHSQYRSKSPLTTGHNHHRRSKKEKVNFLTKMLHKILRQGEAIENQLSDYKTIAFDHHEVPSFKVDTKSLQKIHEKLTKFQQKYAQNREKSFLESTTLSSSENQQYHAYDDNSVELKNKNFFNFLNDSITTTGDDDDDDDDDNDGNKILDGDINQSQKSLFSKRNTKRRQNIFLKEKDNKSKSDDELLLVIENNYDDGDSGVHVAATIETLHPVPPGTTWNMNDGNYAVHDEQLNRQTKNETSKTKNKTLSNHIINSPSCNVQKTSPPPSPPLSSIEMDGNEYEKTNFNIVNNENNHDFQEYHRIPKVKSNLNAITTTMDTTPKRKFRRKCDLTSLRQHKLTTTSSKSTDHLNQWDLKKFPMKKTRYELIRDEISNKMFDLRGLLKREEILTSQLAIKYAMYKAENEIYTTKLGLDMCIEAVQESLDKITKDILDNEQEIFETKMIIDQTQSILDRLKEMMKVERQAMRCGIFNYEMPTKSVQNLNCSREFADNIHEFCDNNASMIV